MERPAEIASHVGRRSGVLDVVMTDAEGLLHLEDEFSEIALSLFASGTVETTLQQIVTLAEGAVDGCLAAAILVVGDGDRPRTLASGNSIALELDEEQITLDEGPCLDAARSGTTFFAEDLADDPRWPRFGPRAVAKGVRSVLATRCPQIA